MMKRVALRLLLFLLAGAIINVAVAWGFTLWSADFNREPDPSNLNDRWHRHMLTTCGSRIDAAGAQRSFGVEVVVLCGPCDCQPGIRRLMDIRSGWPIKSMCGQQQIAEPPVPYTYLLNIGGTWVEDISHPRACEALPLFPLWPGFAINTIFYAAIVWMLFALPFAIRRRQRIKRGLCEKCAYPLGVTSDVCTECGTPVNRRSALHGAAAPCNP